MRTLTLSGLLMMALTLSSGVVRAQGAPSGTTVAAAPPSPSVPAASPPAAAPAAPPTATSTGTAGSAGGQATAPAASGAGPSAAARAGAAKPAPKATPKKKPPPQRKAADKPAGRGRGPATKKPRAASPPRAPDPAARRAVAGVEATGQRAAPLDTPELAAMDAAEKELFAPNAPAADAGAASTSFLAALTSPSGAPRVYTNGLPPPSLLGVERTEPALPQQEWLSSLTLPDLPVRWNTRVLQYLEFYKSDPRGRAIAAIWYRKSGAYEPMLRTILRENKVPEDLLWVAVVESGLRPTAYSSAGAAGLWQFMPDTGKLYGLVIDRWVDERLDPVRSTQAAARYLYDLHRRFGTWELALAAYNMGFGGLLTSVRKYNSNDFWELSRFEAGLPWETTLYVPKIIALAVVAKNPAAFGLTGAQRDAPLAFDEVDVAPGVSLTSIAAAAGVALADVEQLNPQLLALRVPPRPPSRAAAGSWPVRVPQGRASGVTTNLVRARAQEPRVEPIVIRQGESLADLARSRNISERQIEQLNALRSDEVPRPGTVLVVPVAQGSKAATGTADKPIVVVAADLPAPSGYRRVFYRVVPGDTLPGIAMALSVGADEMRRWNALDPVARLHEGMTLLALVPDSHDLSQVLTLKDDEVRVLVVGTDEFFTHFEGQKERVRTTIVVRPGDTWSAIARRTGLSVGMLERINRRSRRDDPQPGERVVVYLPAGSVAASAARGASEREDPAVPLDPPCPEDLPPLPGTSAASAPGAAASATPDTSAPAGEGAAPSDSAPPPGCVRAESE